jgi:hypothetical protein
VSSDRIGDVFPADDPEARFIVAMAMARNDVKHAVQRAAKANEEDAPEFGYYVRLSYGHLIEGLEALGRWRQHSPETQRFLKRLPADVNRNRVQAEACLKKVTRGAVHRVRHRTFHYPSPNPDKEPDLDSDLRRVLEALAGEQVAISAPADDPRNVRLYFADRIALAMAMDRGVDDDQLKADTDTVLEGSVAFVHFVGGAFAAYLEEGQEPRSGRRRCLPGADVG